MSTETEKKPRMTIEEAIEEMPKKGWRLEAGYALRRKGTVGGKGYDACPISSLSQTAPDVSNYGDAAREKGIIQRDKYTIVEAADLRTEDCGPRAKKVRLMLLKAFGLKEEKEVKS